MNLEKYFLSITGELESLKDRVRDFIDDSHWLTDGEWKESVLRSFLAQRLPDTVKIGRGFVITESGPTKQCDIILYRSDIPVLFKEGDLVFLTPDAVLGIVEVKTKLSKITFAKATLKLSKIGRKLGRHSDHCCLALFSYESANEPRNWFTEKLSACCQHESEIVELISIGCSSFVKWWKYSPYGGDSHYENWHSYNLKNMAAGYFVANLIDAVSADSVLLNEKFWFPEKTKEDNLLDKIPFRTNQNQRG